MALGASTPALHIAASPTSHAGASGAPPAVEPLLIIDQTFAAAPGGALTFDLTLTATAGAEATAVVTAGDAITDTDQLVALDRSPASSDGGRASATLPLSTAWSGTTNAAGERSGALRVPVGAAGLDVTVAGIYPVTIDIVDAGTTIASATTFVAVTDDASTADPVTVSILAVLPDPGPAPGEQQLADATEQSIRLLDLAEQVDAPLTIGLPPRLIAALSPAAPVAPTASTPANPGSTSGRDVAGSTATPTDARAVIAAGFDESLRGDELLASPVDDIDPSALVAVNGPTLDAEELFAAQLSDGQDVLNAASPGADVSRAVWVTDRAISEPAAAMLRRLGTRLLVVVPPADSTLGLAQASRGFGVTLRDGATLAGVGINPLGELLQPLPRGSGADAPNRAAVRLLVELLLSHRSGHPPTMLLGLDHLGVPDPAITAHFARLAMTSNAVTIQPLSRLANSVERDQTGGAVVLPARAGVDLTARLAALDEARGRASSAASMLTDSPLPATWSRQFERLLTSDLDDTAAQQQLASVNADVDRLLAAITPPDPSTFTITGSASTLHLVLVNTADAALSVAVDVRSAKLTFPQGIETFLLAAASSTMVDVPVRARSNGTFSIEVRVLTPDGSQLIAGPTVLKARVTRLTGLSQVVTGGALLVLASWWFSHLRRRRHHRSAER